MQTPKVYPVFILIALSVTRLHGDEKPNELDPRDFAIPSRVLSALENEFSKRTSGGYFLVNHNGLTAWLQKTGKFGALTALHDHRSWKDACGIPVPGNLSPNTELRVCDVAYQMLVQSHEGSEMSLMKTESTHRTRDAMLARLIESNLQPFVGSLKKQGTKR